MGKINVTMTIDEKVLDNFKSYCRQNGMKISTRVEIMMRESAKDSEQ